jgi:hypothetical protein
MMFHDDLLTPGVIAWEDPPPEESGMVRLQLDAQARLLYWERIPAQVQTPDKEIPAVDWNALFTAAGLEQSKFQPAEPLWTSLATSDVRRAWTRSTPRQQRVEAAALGGQPVFFAVIEPWTKPDRTPGTSDSNAGAVTWSVLGALLVVIIVASALLAAGNLRRKQGDRRGAFRLAAFIFCIQMALWAARAHIRISFGTFGTFLVALATSVFYGVMMWIVYMALEPYARRRWPQTLISWSAVLIGRVRQAVVGRDVLIGCAAGAALMVLNGISQSWLRHTGGWPSLDSTDPLVGARGALAMVFFVIPHAIREALFFFFLIFLFRALLRNQWTAGVAFALIFAFASLGLSQGHPLFNMSVAFLMLSAMAFLVLRWGLLSLCAALLFSNVAANVPGARTSAWYFGGTVFILTVAVALAGWAFHTSLGGRKLWKEDFFG